MSHLGLDPLPVFGLYLLVALQPSRDVSLVLFVLLLSVRAHLLVYVIVERGVVCRGLQGVGVRKAGQVVESELKFVVVKHQVPQDIVGLVVHSLRQRIRNHLIQELHALDSDEYPLGLEVLPSDQTTQAANHGLLYG